MDTADWIIIGLILAIIIVLIMFKKQAKRGEGFDPSLRVAAGVGGPDYGDPVGQFYDQIQAMRQKYYLETGKEYPYNW